MLTSGEMADLKKKSSTRSRAYIRPRKNGVLLLAGLCATRDTLRLFHGPIYPTYSWLIEFGFRTAVQLADRHHLLSWDELRQARASTLFAHFLLSLSPAQSTPPQAHLPQIKVAQERGRSAGGARRRAQRKVYSLHIHRGF